MLMQAHLLSGPVRFAKMSGTGNDFILIDHRTPLIPRDQMSAFAAMVCRRRFSVGADGLILIEESENADFVWRFFNADGSEAEMCGNGARCAARFAYMHGIAPARMRFLTLAGIIEAQVADLEVAIRMTPPHSLEMERQLDVEGKSVVLHSVDTGVPHAVLFVDAIDRVDVCGQGRVIRHHASFQPAGTNVNFVQVQPDGMLRVRTYERGVEDETMACGTGAVAAAIIAALHGRVRPPVQIQTSGGGRLTILFELASDQRIANVFLKGPAHVIYNGEITEEALLA